MDRQCHLDIAFGTCCCRVCRAWAIHTHSISSTFSTHLALSAEVEVSLFCFGRCCSHLHPTPPTEPNSSHSSYPSLSKAFPTISAYFSKLFSNNACCRCFGRGAMGLLVMSVWCGYYSTHHLHLLYPNYFSRRDFVLIFGLNDSSPTSTLETAPVKSNQPHMDCFFVIEIVEEASRWSDALTVISLLLFLIK